jgi:hypothetical protein
VSGYPDAVVHHAWRDGRRAWERLEEWAARRRSSGSSGDGDAALDALDDIGQVRHLLDQAELAAVRLARSNRRSWTEIATRLGVTRQSAWERWRDVDDDVSSPAMPLPPPVAELTTSVLDRAGRDLRRRGRVKVPDVVGWPYMAAAVALAHADLAADAIDLGGEALSYDDMLDRFVRDQIPEAGAKVPVGTPVRLLLGRGRGGGAGVREPRRPKPPPSHLVEMRDEPRDESVSEAG